MKCVERSEQRDKPTDPCAATYTRELAEVWWLHRRGRWPTGKHGGEVLGDRGRLGTKLAEQVDKDQTKPVAVVLLKKEHYQHKSYGRIFTPVFEITKWASMEPDQEPEMELPAPAPAGRRRPKPT